MLINGFLTAMNNNLVVGDIFCDLEKPFDCINHKILLAKLEFYGTDGKLKKKKIASYLTGKYKKLTLGSVTNNSKSSKWEETRKDVPQIFILGPLFFLFYINDLPKIIDNDANMILFADDTSILVTNPKKLISI